MLRRLHVVDANFDDSHADKAHDDMLEEAVTTAKISAYSTLFHLVSILYKIGKRN